MKGWVDLGATHLLLTMRDIYINSNLNPLTKFTNRRRSTEFKDIRPWNISQMMTKTIPISMRIVRGWSRAVIWASVELCQVEGQSEASPWLATRGNVFKIVDNSGQLVPTFFYLSTDGNINRSEYSDSFFVLFTVLICSDSIFNLLKRVTEGSFLFLCKKVSFPFCTFLQFGGPN